jgi:hypothetical protein
MEVLVVDGLGNLQVRSELEDRDAVLFRTPPEETSEADKSGDPIPTDKDSKSGKAGAKSTKADARSTRTEKAKKSDSPKKVDPGEKYRKAATKKS